MAIFKNTFWISNSCHRSCNSRWEKWIFYSFESFKFFNNNRSPPSTLLTLLIISELSNCNFPLKFWWGGNQSTILKFIGPALRKWQKLQNFLALVASSLVYFSDAVLIKRALKNDVGASTKKKLRCSFYSKGRVYQIQEIPFWNCL